MKEVPLLQLAKEFNTELKLAVLERFYLYKNLEAAQLSMNFFILRNIKELQTIFL